jgi:hypothetical protein
MALRILSVYGNANEAERGNAKAYVCDESENLRRHTLLYFVVSETVKVGLLPWRVEGRSELEETQ